jgi:hypothetical protein
LSNNTCILECTSTQFKNESGTCVEIPTVITNCAILDIKSTDVDIMCDVCKKGYFRSKENRCLPLSAIPNCLVYN